MNPTERLIAQDAATQLPTYLEMCSRAEEIQQEVLLDIVRRAADTEWGRSRSFHEIRSAEDFRDRQAVTEWQDYAAAAARMAEGEPDILFQGRPVFFIVTSGTEGAEKLLPESAQDRDARMTTSRLRLAAIFRHFPELVRGGSFLAFPNRPVTGRTTAGIPCGMASGHALENAPPAMVARLAYPASLISAVDDACSLDYLIMRFALARDVRALVGNNAGRLLGLFEQANRRRDELISDIRDGTISSDVSLDPAFRASLSLQPDPARARVLAEAVAERGCLNPGAAWPQLRLCSFWLSGSVGRFVADLVPTLPLGAQMMDCGYGASEGRINIPLEPGRSAGPLALHAAFFEFMPLEGGQPLMAHQLEDGASYSLLLTTYSGLYRYEIHDIVRVDGFTGRCPNIVFEAKAGDIGNVVGEKTASTIFQREVAEVLRAAGVRVRHYCAASDFDRHGYDLCIEPWPDGASIPDDLAERIDKAMTNASFGFGLMRKQGLMAPIRIRRMAPGWQDSLYARRLRPGISISQIKLPVFVERIPCPEFLEPDQ